jgi:hypothetical protein
VTVNLFVVFDVALDHFGAELLNLNNTTIQPLLIIGIINLDHVDATIMASQSDGALKYIDYDCRWCVHFHFHLIRFLLSNLDISQEIIKKKW